MFSRRSFRATTADFRFSPARTLPTTLMGVRRWIRARVCVLNLPPHDRFSKNRLKRAFTPRTADNSDNGHRRRPITP